MEREDEDRIDFQGWLVESRCRIQALLLEQYRLLATNEDYFKYRCNTTDRKCLLFTIGASFSLWRAVFIADHTRKPDETLDRAKDFLNELIESNAVNFMTERRHRRWSCGYYINNARFRLVQTQIHYQQIEKDTTLLKNENFKKLYRRYVDTRFSADIGDTADTRSEWYETFDALRAMFDHLQARVTANSSAHGNARSAGQT